MINEYLNFRKTITLNIFFGYVEFFGNFETEE